MTRGRRALVLRPDRLGDMICALPAIDALGRADIRADILASRLNAPLLRGRPSAAEVFIADGKPLRRLIRELRSRRYDAVFALQSSARTHLTAGLSGAKRRVGYTGKRFHRLLTHTLPGGGPDEALHETERCLRLIEAAGIQAENRVPRLMLSEEEEAFAEKWLKERGLADGAFLIGAHPGASDPSRQYPAERFAQAVNAVAECAGGAARLVVFAGPADGAEARRLADAAALKTRLAEGLSIRQTAALMRRCGMLFANASGPMHIAGALGTPVAAVFGPTDPRRWGPVGSPSRVAEPSALDPNAEPRRRRQLARSRKIEEVSAEALIRAAASLYEEVASRRH